MTCNVRQRRVIQVTHGKHDPDPADVQIVFCAYRYNCSINSSIFYNICPERSRASNGDLIWCWVCVPVTLINTELWHGCGITTRCHLCCIAHEKQNKNAESAIMSTTGTTSTPQFFLQDT